MSRLPIFTETSDGKLVPMRPAAPPNEDTLQELIGRFPEVISGDGDALLLVQREKSVPDQMDGSARWSLDHLFVTRGGVPVLVEVKRAVDTRIRREVVGQLLDYAANGVAYWRPGTLAEAFAYQCSLSSLDPDLELARFLNDEDPQAFWEQVDANLAAGRIRLVVAADEIPKELARIIEFLNEQMQATVLAVELLYYQAEDGRRTLAPRVIGGTERSEITKAANRGRLPPMEVGAWLDEMIVPRGDAVSRAAAAYIDLVESLGAKVSVASTRGSLVTTWEAEDGKNVYPVFLGSNGRMSIGFGWVSSRPRLQEATLRQAFYDRFVEALGPLSTWNLNGHPSIPVECLNSPETLEAFRRVLTDFVDAARKM